MLTAPGVVELDGDGLTVPVLQSPVLPVTPAFRTCQLFIPDGPAMKLKRVS